MLLVQGEINVAIDLSQHIEGAYLYRTKYNPNVLSVAAESDNPVFALKGIQAGETLLEIWGLNRWGEGKKHVFSVLVVEAPLEPPTGLLLNLSGEAGTLEIQYQRTGPTHNYLSTLYRVQGDGGVEKVKVSGSSLSPAKFHRLKTGRYGASGRSCYGVRHVYCERATFTDLIELPPLPIPKTLKKSASIRFRSPLGLREGNLNESKPHFRTEPGSEMGRAPSSPCSAALLRIRSFI